MATDCLFCKIIAGQIPATVVYRDERVIGIRDINPAAPTHVLLMPVRHINSMAEVEAGDGELLGALHLAAAGPSRRRQLRPKQAAEAALGRFRARGSGLRRSTSTHWLRR